MTVRLGKYWFLAALMACGFVSPTGAPDAAKVAALPALPKIASVGRNELPGAFRKSAPTSLEDLKLMQKRIELLVHEVSPAVVAVLVGRGGGSGVVVSGDGLVFCAAHVCGKPGQTVQFQFPDGRTATGKTLGTNHGTDSGLMQITDPGPWPHVELADPDEVRAGDWVLALGHPGGFLADRPVVVRLGRILRTGEALQTDCTLMAGDSGGPLFDVFGHVVGIHSRISESTTENYHVPVASYLDTWPRLAKGDDWGYEEPPSWPTIGVYGVDGPDGCRLREVREDGPASKAGLRSGDIVLQIEGEPVPDTATLVRSVRKASVGDELTIRVRREAEELALKVKVEARRFHRGGRGRTPPAP